MTDTMRSRVETTIARHRGSPLPAVQAVLDEIAKSLTRHDAHEREARRLARKAAVARADAATIAFVRSFTARYRMPPTVSEIGAQIGMCKRTAYEHVGSMVVRGLLTMERRIWRTIRVVEQQSQQRRTGT